MVSKETSSAVKMPADAEAGGPDGPFNLDGILSELGSFGKYQLLLLLLLSFRDSFLQMCNYNYVFAASDVHFRCSVPECEHLDSQFNASWAQYALNSSAVCQRPVLRSEPWDKWNSSSPEYCAPEWFHRDETMRCEGVVYEDQNSVVAEFDLGCEPWKATMIGTIHNLGLVFSFLLSGWISDRYGRKVIIVCTPVVVSVAGLIKSFSVNYWMLIVFEFLETAMGYGNASLVLSLESVSQKRRVVFSCIADILSSFGSAFFGLIAWRVPYWRHMMRAIYAPLLVVVFYIFLVDEGVRWLLAHNKKDEAVRVLNKVAKINNITLSKTAKEMLTKITDEKSKADQVNKNPAHPSKIFDVLKSKKILLRIALIAACFFCSMFVMTGTIINSISISGNKYLNFSVMMLVAIPTRIITAVTLTKFGRKVPICVAYVLCAFFFITSAFVPHTIWWVSVLFYVIGNMCSNYGVFSLTVVAMEVFPTTSRNSLTNTANTIGRLGAVLAPQTPLLEKYMHGLPSVVFGAVALGSGLLASMLPDTSRAALPDDIVEAERLGDDEQQSETDTEQQVVTCDNPKRDLSSDNR